MSLVINLLPDLRQAKLRNKRRRQLASGVAVVIWSVCGGLIVLLSVYWAGQKAVISGYNKSITDKISQLRQIPNITDALTAQEHLAALPSLYSKRVYISKFLSDYSVANPSDVALTTLTLDTTNALKVSGTGSSYASVAKLARALEQSNMTVGPDALITNQPYFTNVAISGVSSDAAGRVSFTLDLQVGQGAVTNGN
jgi:Tfp pilus assembly protein PilN